MSGYTPGVCNIGRNEIRKRYALAVAGFIISALVCYVILAYGLPRWALLASFIPLIMGFEGFYQGHFRFCAGFAAAGVYDFTGSGGSRKKVVDAGSHRKDMAKAMQIHIYSAVSSVIVIIIIYLALYAIKQIPW
jgi:hypothetical protein